MLKTWKHNDRSGLPNGFTSWHKYTVTTIIIHSGIKGLRLCTARSDHPKDSAT